MVRIFKSVLFVSILVSIICSCEIKSRDRNGDFLKAKKEFKTKLIKKDKASPTFAPLENYKGILKVEYPSNGLKLKAFIIEKNIDSTKRKPVLVFLHGGVSLDVLDLLFCEVFTNEGYIVFAPTYRGENGNEGFFELMLGEVDDAKEAIKWIAKQAYADSTKVYVFGHSIGGGISALLSLEKDVPIAKSASCGGLYNKEFYGWDEIIPFDKNNPEEGKMRVLLSNLNSMQINHYAFIGTEDEYFYSRKSLLNLMAKDTKLKIFYIEGDHIGCLKPSMEKFVDLINNKGNK